jgi:hypothetical protein
MVDGSYFNYFSSSSLFLEAFVDLESMNNYESNGRRRERYG